MSRSRKVRGIHNHFQGDEGSSWTDIAGIAGQVEGTAKLFLVYYGVQATLNN